jgi:hypothetical protein
MLYHTSNKDTGPAIRMSFRRLLVVCIYGKSIRLRPVVIRTMKQRVSNTCENKLHPSGISEYRNNNKDER